jgi:hypothetical protein
MARMSCRIFLHPVSQAPMYSLTWVGKRHLRTKHTAQSVLLTIRSALAGERWDHKLGKKSKSFAAAMHYLFSHASPPPHPLTRPPPSVTPYPPLSRASSPLATPHLLKPRVAPLSLTSAPLATPHPL